MKRWMIACMVVGTAVALLVRFVGLLECGCGNSTVWDFVMVGIVLVGAFAIMLPDGD